MKGPPRENSQGDQEHAQSTSTFNAPPHEHEHDPVNHQFPNHQHTPDTHTSKFIWNMDHQSVRSTKPMHPSNHPGPNAHCHVAKQFQVIAMSLSKRLQQVQDVTEPARLDFSQWSILWQAAARENISTGLGGASSTTRRPPRWSIRSLYTS